MNDLALGAIWYSVFLFSLTLHEAGHAWAAERGGDLTAARAGQVSLDPRPHIRREPFGTVLVPLLSFVSAGWMMGWASTPYDPRWALAYPRRAAWMALAGPAGNLLLVIVAVVIIRLGILFGAFEPPFSIGFGHVAQAVSGVPEVIDIAAVFVSVLFTLNLLLLVFNLIPVPPLDGFGAMPLVLGTDLALRVQRVFSQPQLSLIGLLAAWFMIGSIFRPIFLAVVRFIYPEVSYS